MEASYIIYEMEIGEGRVRRGKASEINRGSFPLRHLYSKSTAAKRGWTNGCTHATDRCSSADDGKADHAQEWKVVGLGVSERQSIPLPTAENNSKVIVRHIFN
jgi:hypothetical protein